jgi:hypothetical protein
MPSREAQIELRYSAWPDSPKIRPWPVGVTAPNAHKLSISPRQTLSQARATTPPSRRRPPKPPPRPPPRAATRPPPRAATRSSPRAATLAAYLRRHGRHQEPPRRAATAAVHRRQGAPRPPPGRAASTRRQGGELRRPGRQAGHTSLLHTVALMKKDPIAFSCSF